MLLLYSFRLAGARKPPAPEPSSSHLLLLAPAPVHSIGILSAGIHGWQYLCPFESAEGRLGYLQDLPDQRCGVLHLLEAFGCRGTQPHGGAADRSRRTPVFVAIGPDPLARVILPLIGEAAREAGVLQSPKLFEEAVVEFLGLFPTEKLHHGLAPLAEREDGHCGSLPFPFPLLDLFSLPLMGSPLRVAIADPQDAIGALFDGVQG